MTLHKIDWATLVGVLCLWFFQMTGCVSPKEVAQNSLIALYEQNVPSERADEEAFVKDIGFNSLEEVADAQLGSPLQLYTIHLVQLKKFRAGDDASKLLTETNRVIFPLIVNGQTRSSLIVRDDSILSHLKNMNWKGIRLRLKNLDWNGTRLSEFGFPRLMPEIEKRRHSSSSFLVSIAQLRLFMLGDRKGERLVLTIIEGNRYLELEAGEERDAAELFSKISPHAKRVYESDEALRQQSLNEGHQDKLNTERASYVH